MISHYVQFENHNKKIFICDKNNFDERILVRIRNVKKIQIKRYLMTLKCLQLTNHCLRMENEKKEKKKKG